ncbi:MAG: glycoside hydrolase family 2 protein [Bacteroidales bacterium]
MKRKILIAFASILIFGQGVFAQTAMINVEGRKTTSLNGKWDAIIDLFSFGNSNEVYKNEVPTRDNQFKEYSFGNGLRLDVPGDWNSQMPELKYYESTVWYKRDFKCEKSSDKRYFLHFGAVNYLANVFVNGVKVGSHEGGFSPFQFEITNRVKAGSNFVVVEVNNGRKPDNIPAMAYDWWNYGGITRDVDVIETPREFISDYTVGLADKHTSLIAVEVKLSGVKQEQKVVVSIPELALSKSIVTDSAGIGRIEFKAKPTLWSPENPKLYKVCLSSKQDTVQEKIGFRTIEVKGTDILLNGRKIFLAGINAHDEIPQRQGRAYTASDAAQILREVKELGCNYLRLTHYPSSEIMVRMAEEMGILMWEEIPLWQKIDFQSPKTKALGEQMLREMVARDKNRCAIILWSMANETSPTEARSRVLKDYIRLCRSLDNSRLVTVAFNNVNYDAKTKTVNFNDSLQELVDVVSINKYFGWYTPWPDAPETIRWNLCPNKPLIYSEFGGEALYGQSGNANTAWSWSEEYQEKLYKDHIKMFANIPNFRGVSPWVLYDFRSPYRLHQTNQQEWNRKGIISDKGMRKKAWYVLRDFYQSKVKTY